MLSLICAMAKNRAIGRRGELLWRISFDLKRFKRLTMGHTVIMGRVTYESIGRPLPGRTNVVLTRRHEYFAEGCRVIGSLDRAVDFAMNDTYSDSSEIFVIGGGQIYQQTMPLADKIYLTVVDDMPSEADVFFPEADGFEVTGEEGPYEENGLEFVFLELTRIENSQPQ